MGKEVVPLNGHVHVKVWEKQEDGSEPGFANTFRDHCRHQNLDLRRQASQNFHDRHQHAKSAPARARQDSEVTRVHTID